MIHQLDITIYILFRNRDSQLGELIDSLTLQRGNLKRIVLSDNSDPKKPGNLSTTNKYKLQILEIETAKRTPNYESLWEHIAACAKDCSSKWVCFLHDDDILLSNFSAWINSIYKTLEKQTHKLSAVAPNCYVSFNKNESKSILREFDKKNIILSNTSDLLNRYYSFNKQNIAAFPTYVYNTSLIKSVTDTPLTLGNYSDVQLLSRLIKIAPILWTPEVVFIYRLHGNNMVSEDVFKDRLRTLRWISNTNPSLKNKYRIWLFIIYLKNNKSKKHRTYLKTHAPWIIKKNLLLLTKTFFLLAIIKLRKLAKLQSHNN